MAQIDLSDFSHVNKQRNVVHEKVPATYTAFEFDAIKYVQIDTYGRIGRENPEKISQSLQIDRSTAKILINILMQEFNL